MVFYPFPYPEMAFLSHRYLITRPRNFFLAKSTFRRFDKKIWRTWKKFFYLVIKPILEGINIFYILIEHKKVKKNVLSTDSRKDVVSDLQVFLFHRTFFRTEEVITWNKYIVLGNHFHLPQGGGKALFPCQNSSCSYQIKRCNSLGGVAKVEVYEVNTIIVQ